MANNSYLVSVVVLLSLLVLPSASAETLDVAFSGSVVGRIPLSTGEPLTTLESGTGSFSLDLDVPDRDPSPTKGFYPGALVELKLVFASGLRVEYSGAAAFVYDQSAPLPDHLSTGTIGTSASDPLILTDRFGNTATYSLAWAHLYLSAYSSASPHDFLPDDSIPTLLPTEWPFASVTLQYRLSSSTPVISDPPFDGPLTAPQVSFHFLNSVRVPIIAAIDIRPGSDVNPINPFAGNVISVAILTTEEFDALTVDADSVGFGPDESAKVHRQAHVEDVEGDGDLDLVLHFRTQDTGIEAGDTEACLIGQTYDGVPIEGCDSITTVPPN